MFALEMLLLGDGVLCVCRWDFHLKNKRTGVKLEKTSGFDLKKLTSPSQILTKINDVTHSFFQKFAGNRKSIYHGLNLVSWLLRLLYYSSEKRPKFSSITNISTINSGQTSNENQGNTKSKKWIYILNENKNHKVQTDYKYI